MITDIRELTHTKIYSDFVFDTLIQQKGREGSIAINISEKNSKKCYTAS